jgi:predicted P-loop ATPase
VNLSFNSFNRKPIMKFNGYHGPINDEETRHVWLKCETKFGFRPPKDLFFDITANVAHEKKFHPVKDYLDSLEWDGQPRVDEWLIKLAGAADNDYVRAVSALTLIAAVRRIRKPGVKFDQLTILETGDQGKGKSTALRILSVQDEWFSDDLPLDVDAKELIERTEGKWIIEAQELSGMRASKTEHLKALLSRQVDGPVRLAYGRFPVEVPRQFLVIGTTNSHMYLHDSTGNRRFWPIRIKEFDLKLLKAERDQIWAEAAAREADGESITLPETLWPVAAKQQERRRAEDPWEATLEGMFHEEYQRLTPDDVWDALVIPVERRNDTGERRIVEIMQRLGFRRMTIKCHKRKINVKGWARGEGKRDTVILGLLPQEEIEAGKPEAPEM